MRLSVSIRKNLIQTNTGWITNRFKIKSRRNVLIFEEIIANYVKLCENSGHEAEIAEIGQKWMNLVMDRMVPNIFKRTPIFFLNNIMKKVWINLGLLSDLHAIKKNNKILIETREETVTRLIGKNECLTGFYAGILNVLFSSQVFCSKKIQTRKSCKYFYELLDKKFSPLPSKKKEQYDRLNLSSGSKGITLKSALESGIFQLKEDSNRILFRGKDLWYVENTGFHILGNRKILLDKVPKISYNFFRQIIIKKSSCDKKLNMIKTLLQSMGWGVVNIINKKNRILFEISNLPHGMQIEEDNWDFLVEVILGYMWLIDKKFRINDKKCKHGKLVITYFN